MHFLLARPSSLSVSTGALAFTQHLSLLPLKNNRKIWYIHTHFEEIESSLYYSLLPN